MLVVLLHRHASSHVQLLQLMLLCCKSCGYRCGQRWVGVEVLRRRVCVVGYLHHVTVLLLHQRRLRLVGLGLCLCLCLLSVYLSCPDVARWSSRSCSCCRRRRLMLRVFDNLLRQTQPM